MENDITLLRLQNKIPELIAYLKSKDILIAEKDILNKKYQSEKIKKEIKTFLEQNKNTTIDLDNVKNIKRKIERNKRDIKNIYKNVDNLIEETEVSNLEFRAEEIVAGNIYSFYLDGETLAKMFLEGKIVYDATMQRGIKTDSKGVNRAVFKDSHINKIYQAILENRFTTTQLKFGLPSDSTNEDNYIEYDTNNKILAVTGKTRIIDGQHRTRALVKIYTEYKNNPELKRIIDISQLNFNIELHFDTVEKLQEVYANINKNLKLDKSQVRQLSSDHYAKVVNILNSNSDSDLKSKIATSRPVGNKLVLFSTLAEAIERYRPITSVADRKIVTDRLMDFFNYLAYRLPEAFGDNAESRKKFKQKNILNENIFFHCWVAIAFAGENYKNNISKIIKNVNNFNKDNPLWVSMGVIRQGKKSKVVNNNNTTINTLVKGILDMIL